MPSKKNATLTSSAENYSAKDWDVEAIISNFIDYDEKNVVYFKKIIEPNAKPKQESHHAFRKQVRIRLAELKGVDLKSIPYPRSNKLLLEYNVEIERLELEKLTKELKEQGERLKLKKLAKEHKEQEEKLELENLAKEFKEKEEKSVNLKKYEIEDTSGIDAIPQTAHKLSDDNEEQSQRKLSDLSTVDSNDNNKATHYEEKSNIKIKPVRKDYSVSRSDLAIVDISYREDKEGKAAFWDHYTFQRITSYPTRVVGAIDNASFLKEQIKEKTYALPISPSNPYKPTPPIIGLYPYPPNDLHGLLLVPGSHADSNQCPNYEDRMKNEENLLKDAMNRGRPVLGICDGGLKIWKLFGGKEVKVHNHSERQMPYLTQMGRVGRNTEMHHLRIELGSILADAMYEKDADKVAKTYPVANSVHNKAMSSRVIPPNMKVVARSIKRAEKAPSNRSPEENVIEAAETCHGAPMLLIQWHPEAYNSDDTDGKYHRSILTYMAKAGDTYYRKQEMLLEFKKLCQSPEGLIKSIKKQAKEYQKTSEKV